MGDAHDSLTPMRPLWIMENFQSEKKAAGQNRQTIPENQAVEGYEKKNAAKKNGRNANMDGANTDIQPSHP